MQSGKQGRSISFATVIWLLIGLIFSVAVSCMLLSHSFNLNRFYDAGEVYDAWANDRNQQWMDVSTEENNIITKSIKLRQQDTSWSYIVITIKGLEQEQEAGYIDFFDSQDTQVFQQKIEVKEGKNLIHVVGDSSYNRVQIYLNQGSTMLPDISKLQFRTEYPEFSYGKLLELTVLIFGAYSILFYVICRKSGNCIKKIAGKNWYFEVGLLQTFYLKLGENGAWIADRIPEKKRAFLRKLAFCMFFFYIQFAKNLKYFQNMQTYKGQMIICLVFFWFIGLLYYETKLERIDWNHRLPLAWVWLWTMACISDFIVPKRCGWVGYIMLFGVGFFFFIWNNRKEPETVMQEFATGIIWNYILNMAFCILCRPQIDGIRYSGGFLNPVSFGRYLTVILIVVLQRLDKKLRKEDKTYKLIPEVVLALSCLIFQWKTQSRSGIIPVMIIGLTFFAMQIWQRTSQKQLLKMILVAVLLTLPLSMMIDWSVHTVPYRLHSQVQFDGDYVGATTVSSSMWTQKIYAAELENDDWLRDSRIYQSFMSGGTLEKITTGRTLYWKAYLREMNLFGHYYKAKLWGAARSAHNGMLQMIYFYGVFIAIPYGLLFVLFFRNAVKMWKKKESEAFFMMTVSMSSILVMLVENLELSFQMLDWYTFHLMLGYFFIDKRRKEEVSHE